MMTRFGTQERPLACVPGAHLIGVDFVIFGKFFMILSGLQCSLTWTDFAATDKASEKVPTGHLTQVSDPSIKVFFGQ
jgi:hypothetical protein